MRVAGGGGIHSVEFCRFVILRNREFAFVIWHLFGLWEFE